MQLDKVHIYRMTHINNVPHILKFGITHKNSSNSNPNFVSIGDSSLIKARDSKSVIVDNGMLTYGSVKTIVLGDFIPFYFGVKMPMLYVTQNGGNFVEKAIKPENIVYIISKVITVAKSNLNYYFSDGHAIDGMSSVYDSSKIEQLISILDWNSINGEYWGGEENLNIKRKKQAEFLVGSDIPFEFVNGFGCYDEDAKIKLVSFGIEEQKIKINKNAYFPKRN